MPPPLSSHLVQAVHVHKVGAGRGQAQLAGKGGEHLGVGLQGDPVLLLFGGGGGGEARGGAGGGRFVRRHDGVCVGVGGRGQGARGGGARKKKDNGPRRERGRVLLPPAPLSLGGAALLTPPADRRGARHQLLARVPHAHPTPCASQRQAPPPSPSSGGGRPPRAPAGAPSTFRDVRARLFFFPRSGAAPRSIPLRCVKPARAGMCGRRCRPPPPMAGEAAHTPTRPSPAAAEK